MRETLSVHRRPAGSTGYTGSSPGALESINAQFRAADDDRFRSANYGPVAPGAYASAAQALPCNAVREDAPRHDHLAAAHDAAHAHGVATLLEFVPADAAIAASLAAHKACANSWESLIQCCLDTYLLVRPYCMFPMALAQQYFSFLLGPQTYLSQPAGQQSQPVYMPPEGGDESQQHAMDIATGADTELWFELIEMHGENAEIAGEEQFVAMAA